MILRANLSIIHIKTTNVINSVQLLKNRSFNYFLLILVIMKVYF